jgi:hypothetical protein
MDDQMHISKTAVSVTSSTSDPGYHPDNVRDTNYSTAWKGVDQTVNAVYVQVDGGVDTWLGGIGAVVYCVVAYDSRNNEQDIIRLLHDTADNPAMSSTAEDCNFTLVKNGSGPVVQWASFSGVQKRYYRLNMPGGERSEPSGSKVPRIYAWAMYKPAGVKNIDTSFSQDALAPGALSMRSKVAKLETAGGAIFTNRYGSTDQDFELNFDRATVGLWTAIRDQLYALNNDHRAFFLQMEGLRSDGTANSAMVRQKGGQWTSQRPFVDQYDTSIQMTTEPWR